MKMVHGEAVATSALARTGLLFLKELGRANYKCVLVKDYFE